MTEFKNRDLKDAIGEVVDFQVKYIQEKVSKNGNPMITLGLSCKDSTGLSCNPLLYNWLVGTPGAARFINEFVASLDEEMTIAFESDSWVCDFELLKDRRGKAKLFLDGDFIKGEWIKAIREETAQEPIKEKQIIDDEIPF